MLINSSKAGQYWVCKKIILRHLYLAPVNVKVKLQFSGPALGWQKQRRPNWVHDPISWQFSCLFYFSFCQCQYTERFSAQKKLKNEQSIKKYSFRNNTIFCCSIKGFKGYLGHSLMWLSCLCGGRVSLLHIYQALCRPLISMRLHYIIPLRSKLKRVWRHT